MTLKKRLDSIEKTSGPTGVEQPECVYLCALDPDATKPSQAMVALLLRGKMGEDVSRLEDESEKAFKRRVENILKQSENIAKNMTLAQE